MKKYLFVYLSSMFICLFGGIVCAYSDDIIDLGQITVTGTSDENSLINKHESNVYSAKDIADLLYYNSGVDLQNRAGQMGLADFSIRCAIFEDSDIRLNGIKLNNPQTGHFNLMLPIVLTDIGSVDVDRNGQSINLNISQNRDSEKTLRVMSGNRGFLSSMMTVSSSSEKKYQRFSFSADRTDGLSDNTDGDSNIFTYSFSGKIQEINVDLLLGHSYRRFGIGGAYAAPWYEREEERIVQDLLILKMATETDSLLYSLSPYITMTKDTFWLDRDAPDSYRNDHKTYVAGIKADVMAADELSGVTLDVKRESIRSNTLGDDYRDISELIFFKKIKIMNMQLEVLPAVTFLDNGPFKFIPKINCIMPLNEAMDVTFDAVRKYRMPSFTELYYDSPSNKGNDRLSPQRTDNFELGIDFENTIFNARVDGFYRRQRDTIDWTRNESDIYYSALNVGKLDVMGLDIYAEYEINRFFIEKVSFEYTRMNMDKSQLYDYSKYAFLYPKDKAVLNFYMQKGRYSMNIGLVYEDHSVFGGRFLANCGGDYTFNENMKIFWDIKNLFDRNYYEIYDVEGDGMDFKVGFQITF
ncbi:MAG: TonB-dependent receptor [Candidatus Omnitrophica bacterium]|nr:TonB-dependent receptor [Candidatus Omnitrophota bacterium]MDD5081442.1 TonB-dependent receptor [Candidatus Omnitrophota bacterium]